MEFLTCYSCCGLSYFSGPPFISLHLISTISLNTNKPISKSHSHLVPITCHQLIALFLISQNNCRRRVTQNESTLQSHCFTPPRISFHFSHCFIRGTCRIYLWGYRSGSDDLLCLCGDDMRGMWGSVYEGILDRKEMVESG